MIVVVGERENSKSVWAFPDTGGSTPDWTADTGGNTNACVLDSNNNVYVCGENASSKNVWKLNSSGTIVQSIQVGAGATLHGICVDEDSNVYVCGEDASGVNAWKIAANFGSSSAINSGFTGDQADDIKVDSSGNIFLCTRDSTKHIVKYNSSFVEQWSRDRISPITDYPRSIALHNDEAGIVVACGDPDIAMFSGLEYYSTSDGAKGDTVAPSGAEQVSVVVDFSDVIYFTQDASSIYSYTYSGSFSQQATNFLQTDGIGRTLVETTGAKILALVKDIGGG